MPLKKFGLEQEIITCSGYPSYEEIKKLGETGCNLFPTKSEAIDIILEILFRETVQFHGEEIPLLNFRTEISIFQIIDAIDEAWFFERKKRSGATFEYPTSLTAYEWLVIEAINDGKDKAEAEHERTKKKG